MRCSYFLPTNQNKILWCKKLNFYGSRLSTKTDWSNIRILKAPVPCLDETLKKYLEYAKVISTTFEWEKTRNFAEEFLHGDGPNLQKQLLEISDKETNWVNKFWLTDMYLGNRLPLPIYSNPGYVMPDVNLIDSSDQSLAQLGVCMIYGVYDYKSRIDMRSIPRDFSTGKDSGKPLCMSQYWKLFTSYRRCLTPVDQLTDSSLDNSGTNHHIIVMYHSKPYFFWTVKNGQLDHMSSMINRLTGILQDARKGGGAVVPVSALTACHRDKAASIWEKLLKDRHNENLLAKIESSTFVLCLDEIQPKVQWTAESGWKERDEQKIWQNYFEERIGNVLHGNGVQMNSCNRWFDKTLQFIINRAGNVGFNYEHSVAEGIVIINLVEHVSKYINENLQNVRSQGSVNDTLPEPMVWNIPGNIADLLVDCTNDIDKLIKSLDFLILFYTGYGKNYPKSKNISPDAYIQMALQWTFYRCHGKLVSTYESCTIRRFLFGRVENIRSATLEALEWIQAMEDFAASNKLKTFAFDKALKKQATVMRQAMAGHGIDNHLNALKALNRGDARIFTDSTFTELFRFPLSTSQVPTNLEKTIVGYGHVVEDGYGCGYNPKDETMLFTIASSKDCSRTDSEIFRKTLKVTLDDMKEFIDEQFPSGVNLH